MLRRKTKRDTGFVFFSGMNPEKKISLVDRHGNGSSRRFSRAKVKK